MSSLFIGPRVAAEVEFPERHELSVHVLLESQGSVPEEIATPLIEDHQVNGMGCQLEYVVQGNFHPRQVIHPIQARVLVYNLQPLEPHLLSSSKQAHLKTRNTGGRAGYRLEKPKLEGKCLLLTHTIPNFHFLIRLKHK